MAPIQTYLRDNLQQEDLLVRQIGCVIGTHAGPGAFGIAFFDKTLTLDL
ncbi:DegV family protein [Faecalibacterium prausnitzii]